MSLLTRKAPHTVHVHLREPQLQANGTEVFQYVGDPIPVQCAVQVARDWSSAEEMLTGGLQVLDMRVVYARTWPGDIHSHVSFDGDLYEMQGAPGHLRMSARTSHWRVTMRRIGDAP